MLKNIITKITNEILEQQDENGCWNVLKTGDKYYPELNYYVPNYKSTLWTLVLLADIQTPVKDQRILKPLQIITDNFYETNYNICAIGKSHFPIPCLNGNILYLHSYFGSGNKKVIDGIVDFFAEYQRFDDGDFHTPSKFPYFSNKSCYGKHTCIWGVIKLLKGLSFIPENNRSANAVKLLKKCVDFILLHRVCYSSRNTGNLLRKNIDKLTFPNMYNSDFLEILWLLKRENIKSEKIKDAIRLLKSKMLPNNKWKIERPIKEMLITINSKNYGDEFITNRANEVLDFYE